MSAAVSLVHDDQLWPDNPSCPLYDPEAWRREVEVYLDERAVAGEHTVAPDSELTLESPRGFRRRVMWSRIRGNRPTDPVELSTTKWYKRDTKKRQPMVKCTATVPVLTREGKLEMRTRRRRFACAPNGRKAFVPAIEAAAPPEAIDVPAMATTQVVEDEEFVESDVVLLRSAVDSADLAVVMMPAQPADDHPLQSFDGGVPLELIGEDVPEELLELPYGFHIVDGGGAFSRRSELDRLALAAQMEPDWGDPDAWDFGRYEPTHLIVRV